MTESRSKQSSTVLEQLGPRLVHLVEAARKEALRLHSSELTIEHLVCAAMKDEDCAAHEAVCHAFADPDTVFEEVLALAPGLLVVASASTLPFSEGAVRALHSTYIAARKIGQAPLSTRDLAAEAFAALTTHQIDLLTTLGLAAQKLSPATPSTDWPSFDGSFFSHFDAQAKRALSHSNRVAAGLTASEIGPVHLLLGCLQADEKLAEELSVSFSRARLTLTQDHEDPTLPQARRLPLSAALTEFLVGLSPGADSLDMLAALHGPGTEDLAVLLSRHKVTPELLKRAVGAFHDLPL